jgi:hypothetical protein
MAQSSREGSGGLDDRRRFHLAQLCRGFLLLRDGDMERATSFLRTFLNDMDKDN